MRDEILSKLRAKDSPLRGEMATLLVDFVLERRLEEVVDLHGAKRLVLEALTEQNVARAVSRHIKPGWRRYNAAIRASDDLVGALVPEEARQRIRDAVAAGRLPKAKWTKGAIEPALIRKLFAPVFANLLVNFVKRLPLVGVATPNGPPSGKEGSGLAGRLTRNVQKRAEKLVDAGRNVMGGLGVDLERKLQATIREFSEAAVGLWRDSLRDRLKSDEGRALIAQISQQVTDHVMMTRLRDLHADTERFPIEQILDIAPAVIAHSVTVPLIFRIIDAEVNAFLEAEGKRTLKELLDEHGILAQAERAAVASVEPLAAEFFASEAFSAWLERLLAK